MNYTINVTVENRRKKNPHAVALGSLGGKARAEKLSAVQRSEIAREAGRAGGRGRKAKLSPERQSEIAAIAGRVGGKARAEKLSPHRRRQIARKAAAARWKMAKNKTEK